MTTLSIDLETYSGVDLKTCGGYKYVEDLEILLLAYAVDDNPVTQIDLASGEEMPEEVLSALYNKDIMKTAFNAQFERLCLNKYLGKTIPIEQWDCTMVRGLYLGLPGSLKQVAEVMELDEQKMTGISMGNVSYSSKALISYFCNPCKPTKTNGMRTRNLPKHDPEKWGLFKQYNRQDVVVEREIRRALLKYDYPTSEKKLWYLDQKINGTGIMVDCQLVEKAIECNEIHAARLEEEAKILTGLENPNSLPQIKDWILDTEFIKVDSLTQETIPELMQQVSNPETKRMLEIRQELGKTSVSKYEAMKRSKCVDDRIRGLVQFYGANRTGRWAGRLVQIHNLPRNYIKGLATAREIVKSGNFEMLDMVFDEPLPNILSQLIRTAFIPPEGKTFVVSDFSAIEARIVAWLAGEDWVLDVFRGDGKIYEAAASQMFNVPLDKVSKDLRQKGKVATLACGYQGGEGALVRMGALNQLTENELPLIIEKWRMANPNIVALWKRVEDAAKKAISDKKPVTIKYLTFYYDKGILFVTLPSSRKLSYIKPKVSGGKITYDGMDQNTKKWCKQQTYGGKLVENIVQAIARDCLAEAIIRLDEHGYKIVAHIHDEVIIESDDIEGITEIMKQPVLWAEGLPMNAESFSAKFYRKE